MPVRHGARGVGTHVGAALLLRHAHAHRHRRLGAGELEARVVARAGEQAREGLLQRGVRAQRRRDGVGHRHRTQHRGLELGEQHEAGGALHVAGAVGRPRRAVQAMLQRRAQQHVIAGMELDLVDAVAEAVVRMQRRRVQVGQARVGLHPGAAGLGAQRRQPVGGQARRVEFHRVAQRGVRLEEVHVLEGRHLVQHDVGRAGHGLRRFDGHQIASTLRVAVRAPFGAAGPALMMRVAPWRCEECRPRGRSRRRRRSRGARRSPAGGPAR